MIKIIRNICYCDLDNNPSAWYDFPLIPASASYKETSSADEHGRLREIELSFRLSYITVGMKGNLAILVQFCGGEVKTIGTVDNPVRLKFEDNYTITASCEWKTPDR